MKANKKVVLSLSIILTLVSIIRIVLQFKTPLYPLEKYGADDLLMVRYADLLGKNGKILGDYGGYTLLKLPGYALFLWLNNKLGINYSVLYGLIYAISCIVLFIAIYLLTRSVISSFICYLFVVFCPVCFGYNVFGRVYCVALVPILTVLIIACYIGIIARRKKLFKQTVWVLLAGVVYGYYRITRYDSIWMTMFMFGITLVLVIITFVELKGRSPKEKVIKIMLYSIPFVVGLIFTNSLCLINYCNYGIYNTTDFNETHFAEMCKMLMKIEPEKEYDGVYVTRDTLQKASNYSDGLKSLVDNRNQLGWNNTLNNGEIPRDFYAWNLRYAAIDLGFYSDARNADDQYRLICEDLERAFSKGCLPQRDVIAVSPFSAPIDIDDIPEILHYSMSEGMYSIISFSAINSKTRTTSELSDGIESKLFEEYTNEELASPDELYGTLFFSGWMFADNPDSTLQIKLLMGDQEYNIDFTDSKDVYRNFEVEQAKTSRFSVCLNDTAYDFDYDDVMVEIILDNKIIKRIKMNELSKNIEAIDGCKYCIDNYRVYHSDSSVIKKYDSDVKWCSTLDKVIKIGGYVSWFIFYLSIISIVIELGVIKYKIKNKTGLFIGDSILLIMKIGLLLTVWAIVLIQSERSYTGWLKFKASYCSGAYILYALFLGLCVTKIIDWGNKFYHRKKSE